LRVAAFSTAVVAAVGEAGLRGSKFEAMRQGHPPKRVAGMSRKPSLAEAAD
jgi:hypothetical protein